MATGAAAANKRPIVIRKVKKVVGGHHGGAWKVAYADFVTAMMAFFMLLWLISSPDEQKLKGLAEYFSPSSASGEPGESMSAASQGTAGQTKQTSQAKPDAGGSPSSPAATAGAQSGGSASVPDPTLRIVAEELKLLLQPTSTPSAQVAVKMHQDREGLRISLMDDLRRSMFRPGTADLNTYARFMLGEVAKRIAKTDLRIAIEGHTDNVGGTTGGNWQLSSARALAARAALVDAGFPADRIAEVVALADTQPVYPEEPGRPENRRIAIVLLAEGSPLPDIRSLGR